MKTKQPKLQNFFVSIEETYTSSFDVEAETYEEALAIIQAQYEANEILVDLNETRTDTRYSVMDEDFNTLQDWE